MALVTLGKCFATRLHDSPIHPAHSHTHLHLVFTKDEEQFVYAQSAYLPVGFPLGAVKHSSCPVHLCLPGSLLQGLGGRM